MSLAGSVAASRLEGSPLGEGFPGCCFLHSLLFTGWLAWKPNVSSKCCGGIPAETGPGGGDGPAWGPVHLLQRNKVETSRSGECTR